MTIKNYILEHPFFYRLYQSIVRKKNNEYLFFNYIFSKISKKTPIRMLDICSGDSHVLSYVNEYVEDYLGVDNNEKYLKDLSKKWPKYKFLLHEIWSPTDKHLSDVVEKEREKSRIQIFTSLYEHNKTDYARQNAKHEDTLDAPEKKQVFDTSYKAFSDFLKLAGKPVSEIPAATIMQHKLEGIPNDAETTDQSSEEWTSEDS